jgi:hypothetical protein
MAGRRNPLLGGDAVDDAVRLIGVYRLRRLAGKPEHDGAI